MQKTYRNEISKAKSKFNEMVLLKILSDKPKQFWNVVNPKPPTPLTLTYNEGQPLSDK